MDGDGDATEVVDAVAAFSETDTVEGTGSTEGWITEDMDAGAYDEAGRSHRDVESCR